MSSLLNDAHRASLVLAFSSEGELTVLKNGRGPRMRDAGLAELARLLRPEDRDALMRAFAQSQGAARSAYPALTARETDKT